MAGEYRVNFLASSEGFERNLGWSFARICIQSRSRSCPLRGVFWGQKSLRESERTSNSILDAFERHELFHPSDGSRSIREIIKSRISLSCYPLELILQIANSRIAFRVNVCRDVMHTHRWFIGDSMQRIGELFKHVASETLRPLVKRPLVRVHLVNRRLGQMLARTRWRTVQHCRCRLLQIFQAL